MSQQNGDSIEMVEIAGDPLSVSVTRGSFRISVRGKENYFAVINGASYPLVDIGLHGICITVDAETSIASDDLATGCELHAGEQVFSGLTARTVHYSLDDDSHWVCGIEWQDVDSEFEDGIENILHLLRKELLNNE